MSHPRAADDFATIRARMEELRRERDLSREDAMELARRAYRQLIREAVSRFGTEKSPIAATGAAGATQG